MMELMWPLNTGRISVFVVGKPVAEARNEAVTRALAFENNEREVSQIFWVDDDVLIARTALIKLYQHYAPIVSGVYFSKGDVSEPLIFPGRGCGSLPYIPDQVIETWGHGSGLTLINTDVYRKMQKELNLPLDKFGNVEWYKTPIEPNYDGTVLWCGGTEDLFFCENARKLGYKSIVDCTSDAFGWHFDRATGKGFPRQQFNAGKTGQPIVWNTPDGPKEWSN